MTQIIEITTRRSIDQYATCANTFPAFVQSQFGNKYQVMFQHRFDGHLEGTIKSARGHYMNGRVLPAGTCFDIVWSNDRYLALEA